MSETYTTKQNIRQEEDIVLSSIKRNFKLNESPSFIEVSINPKCMNNYCDIKNYDFV